MSPAGNLVPSGPAAVPRKLIRASPVGTGRAAPQDLTAMPALPSGPMTSRATCSPFHDLGPGRSQRLLLAMACSPRSRSPDLHAVSRRHARRAGGSPLPRTCLRQSVACCTKDTASTPLCRHGRFDQSPASHPWRPPSSLGKGAAGELGVTNSLSPIDPRKHILHGGRNPVVTNVCFVGPRDSSSFHANDPARRAARRHMLARSDFESLWANGPTTPKVEGSEFGGGHSGERPSSALVQPSVFRSRVARPRATTLMH